MTSTGKELREERNGRRGARGAPPLAPPGPALELDLPEVEAFLKLPMEERRRRRQEVSRLMREAFAGMSIDDVIAEKHREAEGED